MEVAFAVQHTVIVVQVLIIVVEQLLLQVLVLVVVVVEFMDVQLDNVVPSMASM